MQHGLLNQQHTISRSCHLCCWLVFHSFDNTNWQSLKIRRVFHESCQSLPQLPFDNHAGGWAVVLFDTPNVSSTLFLLLRKAVASLVSTRLRRDALFGDFAMHENSATKINVLVLVIVVVVVGGDHSRLQAASRGAPIHLRGAPIPVHLRGAPIHLIVLFRADCS